MALLGAASQPPHNNGAIDDADSDDVFGVMMRSLMKSAGSYAAAWASANPVNVLPQRLQYICDFETFSQYAYDTMRFLNATYIVVMQATASGGEFSIPRDDAVVLFGIVDRIIGDATDFWFSHICDMDNESHLLRGDLPPRWIPAQQACMCMYTLSLVSSCLLSGFAYRERSVQFTAIDAFNFPGVVTQNVMITLKPIASYSAMEVIWALDTLSHAWYTINVDDSIMDYVHAIALRVGMLVRSGASVADYEGEANDSEVFVTYVTPSELHMTPAKTPVGSSEHESWCAPSQLFRDITSGRLGALISTNWCAAKYRTVSLLQLGSVVTASARARKAPRVEFVATAIPTIDSAPVTPAPDIAQSPLPPPSPQVSQDGSRSWWAHLVPKRRIEAVGDHGTQPTPPPTPRSAPRSPLNDPINRLAKFDIHVAGVHVAKLLYRYATESATVETTRDLYAAKLIEAMQCPGDLSVFKARNRHHIASSAPTNVLKMLRGDKFTKEVLRRAKTVGPEPVLKQAVMKHIAAANQRRIQQQHPQDEQAPTQVRSVSSIDEEIAGLCVLDTLFRNRYGINWMEDYFVPLALYQSNVEDRKIAPESPSADARIQADASYSRLPRVVMFRNTFDLLFEGVLYKADSLFEAAALWLAIVLIVYEGRIPASDEPNNPSAAATSSSSSSPAAAIQAAMTRDIKDLCKVVTNGHTTYVVRSSGEDRTQFGVASFGGVKMSVITSV